MNPWLAFHVAWCVTLAAIAYALVSFSSSLAGRPWFAPLF